MGLFVYDIGFSKIGQRRECLVGHKKFLRRQLEFLIDIDKGLYMNMLMVFSELMKNTADHTVSDGEIWFSSSNSGFEFTYQDQREGYGYDSSLVACEIIIDDIKKIGVSTGSLNIILGLEFQ